MILPMWTQFGTGTHGAVLNLPNGNAVHLTERELEEGLRVARAKYPCAHEWKHIGSSYHGRDREYYKCLTCGAVEGRDD